MTREFAQLSGIFVENGVSLFDGKPFCRVECRDENDTVRLVGQLDAETTRSMANQWLEVAAVAEYEALMINYLLNKVGIEKEAVGQILMDLRQLRTGEGVGEEDDHG